MTSVKESRAEHRAGAAWFQSLSKPVQTKVRRLFRAHKFKWYDFMENEPTRNFLNGAEDEANDGQSSPSAKRMQAKDKLAKLEEMLDNYANELGHAAGDHLSQLNSLISVHRHLLKQKSMPLEIR